MTWFNSDDRLWPNYSKAKYSVSKQILIPFIFKYQARIFFFFISCLQKSKEIIFCQKSPKYLDQKPAAVLRSSEQKCRITNMFNFWKKNCTASQKGYVFLLARINEQCGLLFRRTLYKTVKRICECFISLSVFSVLSDKVKDRGSPLHNVVPPSFHHYRFSLRVCVDLFQK